MMYVIRTREFLGTNQRGEELWSRWGYVMDDYSGDRKRWPKRNEASDYMRLSFPSPRKTRQYHVIEEGKSK